MEKRAKYTAQQLTELGKKGHAFKNPDGSFSYPIDDLEDLKNAISAVGRGNASHDAIRKYIMGRAKAMGQSDLIPDNWSADGSLGTAAGAPGLDTRKAKAELLKGREVRRMPTSAMECRAADGMLTFRGVASSVESPYQMGFYTETIKRGAFDKTLAGGPDVQLLINHEGLPIARTTNGSLRLFSTDTGLEFEGRASEDDPDAARVAAKIGSGLMDQCSFAFRVVDQEWNDDYDQRAINELSLDRGDVSIVNYGANPNTPVTVRSLLDAWDELSEADLAELRARLGIGPVEPEPEPAPAAQQNLYLFQARARALALHQPSNSATR